MTPGSGEPRVLLTGASGLVGHAILHRLRADGARLLALGRDNGGDTWIEAMLGIGPQAEPAEAQDLLAEDSTFFGDLFPHVVEFKGVLYLEDGLHRAVRTALHQRTAIHARVLVIDG